MIFFYPFIYKTSRSGSLFNAVKIRVLANTNFPFEVRVTEPGSVISTVVTQNNTVLSMNLSPGNHTIFAGPVFPTTTPTLSEAKDGKLQVKTPNGAYEKPDVVWRIESDKLINPTNALGFTPNMNMFPVGSPANTFSISKGVGHAYIRYSKQSGGKLRKPIIFVDGIDFATEESNFYDKSINGSFSENDLIRHGDTGWDIFSMGADDGFNNDPNITETFREYPAVFKNLSDRGYDIVFLDFAEGATYLQKNVEVLKSLLRKIKDEKIGSYPNIVVGPSMGGQIARIALAEMERDNEDHCTSLYVSFDSPHKGANIPLGLQAMAWAASETELEKEQWRKLNYPAARQMLVEHLANTVSSGRIKLEKLKVEPPNTLVPLPIGPTLLIKNSDITTLPISMPSDLGQFRSKYVDLLNSVGYPKKTNNIAISDGNIEGLTQGFNGGEDLLKGHIRYDGLVGATVTNIPKLSIGTEVADDLGITAAVNGLQVLATLNPAAAHVALNALIPNDKHRVFDLDINAVPGSPTKVYNHHSCTGAFEDKSHLNLSKGEGNVLFHLASPSAYDNLLGKEIPCEYTVLKATINPLFVNTFFNYDNAPGGGRRDLKSIKALIEDKGTTSSTAPIIESNNQDLLQCFIPAFSAFDVQLPVNNTNLSTLNIKDLLDNANPPTPFEQIKGKTSDAKSLRHVEADADIRDWVRDILDVYSFNLGSTLSTVYNFGLWRKHITKVDIVSGGQLLVNEEGATGFALTAPEGNSNKSTFEAYVAGCSTEVSVKAEGKFIIGANGTSTKKGIVHITTGSTVINEGGEIRLQKGSILYVEKGGTLHIKSGILRVMDNSQIIVKTGGKLIIEPAATVELNNSAVTTSSEAKIEIETKATLQLTGINQTGYNFNFSGNGHFSFNNGHVLKMEDLNTPSNPVDFKWKGAGKDMRMIKLNTATLKIPERNVTINSASIEYNKTSMVYMDKGKSLNLIDIRAYQVLGIAIATHQATGFKISEGTGSINVTNSTFSDLLAGLNVFAIGSTVPKSTGYSTINNYSIRVNDQTLFERCATGTNILNNQNYVTFSGNVTFIDNAIGAFVDYNAKTVRFNTCVFEHNEIGSMVKNMPRAGSVLYSNTMINKNIHGSVLFGIKSAVYRDCKIQDHNEDNSPDVGATQELLNSVASIVGTCGEVFMCGILDLYNSNIIATEGTRFLNNNFGIYKYVDDVDKDQKALGNPDAIVLDCTTFDNNLYGVKGQDVVLQNDALFSQPSLSYPVRSNNFIQGKKGKHLFDICYSGIKGKIIPSLIQMRHNYWDTNKLGGGVFPDPMTINFNTNCTTGSETLTPDCGHCSATKSCIQYETAPELKSLVKECPFIKYPDPDPQLSDNEKSFDNINNTCKCNVIVAEGGNGTPYSVHAQYRMAYANLVSENSADVDKAMELFEPIALLPIIGKEESTSCDHYIRMARAFTDIYPDENGIFSGRVQKAPTTITMFPNPASDMLTIRLTKGEYEIDILDNQGRVLEHFDAENELIIDTSAWSSGIYQAMFKNKATSETSAQKIVVMKMN